MSRLKSKIEKERVESMLQSVIGTFALEGTTLDDEDIARCRAVLSGEADAEELINQMFEKYRVEEKKSP